eukprot:scaffold876_cov243-Pinguiococcus_pyrenoidosus.AAC.14
MPPALRFLGAAFRAGEGQSRGGRGLFSHTPRGPKGTAASFPRFGLGIRLYAAAEVERPMLSHFGSSFVLGPLYNIDPYQGSMRCAAFGPRQAVAMPQSKAAIAEPPHP